MKKGEIMQNAAKFTELFGMTVEAAPEGSRQILEQAQLGGLIPNMYSNMANSPGLLTTYRHGYDEFRRSSGFNKIEQEVVFLAISRYQGCAYCVSVHSAIADRNKVPADITDAIRAGVAIEDTKLQSLNVFTVLLVDSRGRPTQNELSSFLASGYSEKQVLELILAISVKTISNFSNHFFDTQLDEKFKNREWQLRD
jgi:AhpD family alkylhydroperoxidase